MSKATRDIKIYDSPEQFRARGFELFGNDIKQWRFRCPSCGHVQTWNDFIAIGMSEKETHVRFFFSCIGRWIDGAREFLSNSLKSPCNYTCGGLINLGDRVKSEQGELSVFPFDEGAAVMTKQKKFPQQFTVQYFAGEGSTNQIIYRTKITGCETEEDKLIDEARAQYVEHPWVSKTATIMAYISKGGREHVAMCEIIDRSRSAKR